MFLPMLLGFVTVVGALYLALRFVRAFERRGADRAEVEGLRAQVAQLEQAIEQLEEGQRFTTRLLTERSSSAPPAP